MSNKDNIKISGEFTIGDWKKLRIKLIKEDISLDWEKANSFY